MVLILVKTCWAAHAYTAPMRNSPSLTTKLLAMGAGFLLVALSSIGLTLWVTWKLEGSAAAVNEAAQRVHPAVNNVAPVPVVPVVPAVAATPVEPERDAATLLGAGQFEAALAALARESPAVPGSPEWFTQGMLRGRAERLAGRASQASAALAALVEARVAPVGLPRELLLDEYARSLLAEASASGLAVREADRLRRAAAEQWRKAQKLEPVRNLAVLRVAHAEALAAVEGEGAGRRTAASASSRSLGGATATVVVVGCHLETRRTIARRPRRQEPMLADRVTRIAGRGRRGGGVWTSLSTLPTARRPHPAPSPRSGKGGESC